MRQDEGNHIDYDDMTERVFLKFAEAFKMVVQHMNKSLSSPLTFNDAKRLAIEEFIERRPIIDD